MSKTRLKIIHTNEEGMWFGILINFDYGDLIIRGVAYFDGKTITVITRKGDAMEKKRYK